VTPVRLRLPQLLLACALVLGLSAVLGGAGPALARAKPNAAQEGVSDRGPVGWQVYRRLDLLPFVREGVTTYQSSSYDPTGHNDDGFSGKYSCLHRVKLGCVMAEHNGPGELEAVWTAGNQQAQPAASGKLLIELDGRRVVDQTWPELTAGHRDSLFAFPLALAPDESWGGSSIQVPMTFRRQMRVISQFNPHYFHVVYRVFTSGSGLPSVTSETRDPGDILSELRAAGARDPKPSMGPAARLTSNFSVRPGHQVVLAHITGTGAITALRLRFLHYHESQPSTPAEAAADVYKGARLRIRFDGVRTVDAPLGEFFGSGLGPAPVRALMFAMDGTPSGWASSWWPMPFARSAEVILDNSSRTTISAGELKLTWARNRAWAPRLEPTGQFGYFHAQGHRGEAKPGAYWTFLQTRGAGTFQGVTLTMEGGYPPYYMEGNERAYVDGVHVPQIQGTGTEDFFDGGWYFWDHPFTLPLSGYPAHETSSDGCPRLTCKTAYRLEIADSVPFDRSILYEIQQGSTNISAEYSSTAYWYQRGTASATH
jgi:hypothetical protein